MQRGITTTGRVILGATAVWVSIWLLAVAEDETTHLPEESSLQQELASRGYEVTEEAPGYMELEHRNGTTVRVKEGEIILLVEQGRLNGQYYTFTYSPPAGVDSIQEAKEMLNVAIDEKSEHVDGNTTGHMTDSQGGGVHFTRTD